MTEELKLVINHRRQKAKDTLADAKLLLDNGRLRSCVNRIYYAFFYEVIALLLTRKLYAATHAGVRALFNQHFVKTSLVTGELGSFYSRMFDIRQKADYEDEENFTKSLVEEWFLKANESIETLEKLF